jgi:hypothetical protein
MARGARLPDPALQSDVDLLSFIDIIESIGRGAFVEPDAPVRRLTAVQFGRIAEVAVENNAGALRQGTVGEYRKRARHIIDAALVEEGWISGIRFALDWLLESGYISPQVFLVLSGMPEAHSTDIWRKAASNCALILRDIEKARARTGGKGRPAASPNGDALARLLDSEIIWDAVRSLPPGTQADRDTVAAAIPAMVRKYSRLGQPRRLGETEQEHVDRHSKRLREQLDRVLANPPSGGFSIIRKSK